MAHDQVASRRAANTVSQHPKFAGVVDGDVNAIKCTERIMICG